ncbi:hypothetical protein Adu01nite_89300 [Paractinoplanes durhamensis]|uniref:Uncharacterized protein n=1 Tax=Paractinoplanes durhamensis TaxID=113563 RepID=A0ABQ3ZCR5_9ACTN|nr:hypothetical protein Adu01nite_89300 [Actinoplanes durhamensis]
MVEQGVAHGREPGVEVGVPDAEPDEFDERAAELFALYLKAERNRVAVRAVVANRRVSNGEFPELVPMNSLLQGSQRLPLVVAAGLPHVYAPPSDLLVLMAQNIDDVG